MISFARWAVSGAPPTNSSASMMRRTGGGDDFSGEVAAWSFKWEVPSFACIYRSSRPDRTYAALVQKKNACYKSPRPAQQKHASHGNVQPAAAGPAAEQHDRQ